MNDFLTTLQDALQDAVDFARDAWGEAWLSMAICAAAWMAMIVGGHADVTNGQAALLTKLGWVLMLSHLPLQGALYRLALGGRAERGLGLGGLQIGGVEGRILGVNLLLAFALLWAAAPAVLLSGLSYLLLRRFDGVTLGPLGHFEWWFLAAGLFWAAALGVVAYLAGRLSLSSPISVEMQHVSPFESWLVTVGRGWTAAAAYALAHAPALIALVAFSAFGLMEPIVAPVGLHGPWPLLDALGAGVVIGGLLAFVQAPMSVGVLTYLYDIWSAPGEIAIEAAVATEVPAPREPAMQARDAAVEPIVEAELASAELNAEAAAEPLSVETISETIGSSEILPTASEAPDLSEPLAAEVERTDAKHHIVSGAVDGAELEPDTADVGAPSSVRPALAPFNPVAASDLTGRFAYETRPWQAGRATPVFTPAVEEPSPAAAPITISLPVKASAAPAALDGAGEAEHAEP